ncbi:MAG: 3-dehydroquinate synthase [Phycisphaerae bacterium]|nr:3-dehydroquinate synthase [Phycisphaerae bacterium]
MPVIVTIMHELDVEIPETPAGRYRIHIGRSILDTVWAALEAEYPKLKKFIVTDADVVAAGHLRRLLGDVPVPAHIIDPPGEGSKHIGTVIAIVDAMEKAFLGRDTLIVALGGGTVGDIAGFAAAIFKRGVNVVQIPTTTVAQADSSVGGKTGVDSAISKNAYGVFWQPAAVYIDVAALATLDDRQYRAGLVESVKHALIADAKYFDYLETHMPAILARDGAALEHIALKNCRIKAAVVEEDPTEKNRRRILNFGHTIGHAVESASGFQLLHGEAVAIGIVAAEYIAQKMDMAAPQRLARIENLLSSLSMPLKIPRGLQKAALIDIIKRDKKAVNQWPRFVLLEAIGRAYCRDGQWAHDVSPQIVDETLDRLYA